MYKFYFNDCLPLNKSEHEISLCFQKTLREYKTIKTKYAAEVDGIITSKLTEQIVLKKDNFTLKNCIETLPDKERELKKYAFSIFKKYPVGDHFTIKNEDDFIVNDYFIAINNAEHEAFNLKLVQENDGVLFSLALHNDLQKNTLPIKDKNGCEYSVLNLFGETNNTNFIDKKIQELIAGKLGNFKKLLFSIGNCSYSERFKDGFNKASAATQEAIIKHFEEARSRKGNTPFYADGVLIKDVTLEKERKIKIFELRIFKPVPYRVYFFEALNKVYLGLIEKKPNDKEQSTHIKTAASIIKQLSDLSGKSFLLPS